MSRDRMLDEIQIEYLETHPEKIEAFIEEAFEEYDEDGDTAALFSLLRVVAQVKSVSNLAEEVGMTRQGLQKALSEKGNARFDNINAIMHALGYRLKPERMERPTR